MSLSDRDDELYRECEETLERFFDEIKYEDLEQPALKDLYVEIKSRYQLVKSWRDDEDIDWVVVDDYLKDTVEEAENFTKAYQP